MRSCGAENKVYLWMLMAALVVIGRSSGFTGFEWWLAFAGGCLIYLLFCINDYLPVIAQLLENDIAPLESRTLRRTQSD